MKRMTKVVVSILATTTLCAFAETVREVAPDGVNEIIYDVDAEGNLTNPRTTLAYVAPSVSVYRLELRADSSGETAWLVGQDGVKRPVVLVSPDEYALLTTRLDLMWEYFNSSRDGRVKLHGRIVNTTIDEVAKEKVETHNDGYIHREKIPAKVDRPRVVFKPRPDTATPPKPDGISDRQFEMRKRLAERKNRPFKTINVEHDAATGKDRVVE